MLSFPVVYNDEYDTIGRLPHSTAIRGPHPNPAGCPTLRWVCEGWD
jgi:hypothetical protein